MTTGGSLILIAAGAILRYAINDSIKDVDLQTVGLILIVIGVIGLIIGLYQMHRARTVVVDDRPVDRRDY